MPMQIIINERNPTKPTTALTSELSAGLFEIKLYNQENFLRVAQVGTLKLQTHPGFQKEKVGTECFLRPSCVKPRPD
jgi:hypothetical protein